MTYTHDIPAVNVVPRQDAANCTTDGPDSLSTNDAGTEISFEWGGGGGEFYVPFVNGGFDNPVMFPWWLPPAGAIITDSQFACRAYTESGGPHPSPDPTDSYSSATYPDVRLQYEGSGTFGGKRIDNLPIGAYGSGLVVGPQHGAAYVIDPAHYGLEDDGVTNGGLSVSIFGGPGDLSATTYAPGGIRIHICYLVVRITYELATPTFVDSGLSADLSDIGRHFKTWRRGH